MAEESTTTTTAATTAATTAVTTAATTITPVELTDEEKAIKKQIEFYFSDANFRRDAFLRGKAQLNVEGWVDIATLLTFKRLQAMTTEAAVVAKCVTDSLTVVVSEDKLRLRRAAPLPEKDDAKYRTMFAQLIPKEATLDELAVAFSESPDFKVESIRMRREKGTKEFIGSAFVEFSTQSMLRSALQYDFTVKGIKLNTCSLEEFLFAAKERREAARNKGGYGDAASPADKRPYQPATADEKVEYTKGLILKLTKKAEMLDREKIREILSPFGKVAFIDYARNEAEGFVRMDAVDGAAAAIPAINGAGDETKEASSDFSVVLLEGDEEEAYWKRIKSNQKALYRSRGGGGGSDRKRNRHR
jgi:hypothetical protein